jgi:hypothetical protein
MRGAVAEQAIFEISRSYGRQTVGFFGLPPSGEGSYPVYVDLQLACQYSLASNV